MHLKIDAIRKYYKCRGLTRTNEYLARRTRSHFWNTPEHYYFSSFVFSSQESPPQIFHLHLVVSSASSSVISTTTMSSLTASVFPPSWQLHHQHPSPNIPSSFLRTCPNHLRFASHIFSRKHPTCAVPLMYSFLILSILVTPNENRNIFKPAISASCLLISASPELY